MKNKYVIIDFNTMESMKDFEGNIKYYDTETDARLDCGMYELDEAWIVKLIHQHIEYIHSVKRRRSSFGFEHSIENSIDQNIRCSIGPNKPYKETKRKLHQLTDDEIASIMSIFSSVDTLNRFGENKIIREDHLIEVKFYDDDGNMIFLTIRTDYEYVSSHKDFINISVWLYDEEKHRENEYIANTIRKSNLEDENDPYYKKYLSLLKKDSCYDESNTSISQGELLDIIKYLQSIDIEI